MAPLQLYKYNTGCVPDVPSPKLPLSILPLSLSVPTPYSIHLQIESVSVQCLINTHLKWSASPKRTKQSHQILKKHQIGQGAAAKGLKTKIRPAPNPQNDTPTPRIQEDPPLGSSQWSVHLKLKYSM